MPLKKKILPLREEFPALKEKISKKSLVYIDSACTALKMKSAANAQRDFLIKFGACAGKRSSHLLSRRVEAEFSQARKNIAEFIGAKSPDEIIFTSGTTEAANMVAGGFPFEKGRDEVIISSLEHNSVFLPFYRLKEQGKIKLKIIPLKNFKLDFKAYQKMLGFKTALVCVSHASNVFGGTVEVKKFIKAAHEKGAKIFVDDAQYISSHKENVADINADVLAFSGHKMGAPFGIGVLYVKKNLFQLLKPLKLGGGTIKEIVRESDDYKVDFLSNNAAYEAGIQNYSGAVALAKAFETLQKIGYQNIRSYMEDLVLYACDRLSKFKEIQIIGNPEDLKAGSIVSFIAEDPRFSIVDFNIFLNDYSKKHFIALRTGRHCADLAFLNSGIKSTIRLSFFVYSVKSDIDALCEAIELYLTDSSLPITDKCNQSCIYCAAKGKRAETEAELLTSLKAGYKTISLVGGEPLVCKDLEKWVDRAKKSGADDIILLTNGLLLNERKIKTLLKKGITQFQINFPAHIEKAHDIITGTKNLLPKRIKAIKSAVKLHKNGVILSFVLNNLNYRILPEYISFVSKEFPSVFFVGIIFIMVKGKVKNRKYLVPKLSEVKPYMEKALINAKKLHVPVIIDGFPLCVLPGFEEYSRDIDRAIRNDETTFGDRGKIKKCLKCGLKTLCSGPRKDYLEIFGDAEIRASKKNPSDIIEKVKKGQLRFNF